MSDDHQATELAARLTADERRLEADEARLLADEQRLLTDEARLEADEAQTGRSRFLSYSALALASTLAIAVTALVFAVIALRQDVGTLGRDAPDASVGTEALQTGSVTTDKLAPGAVGRPRSPPARSARPPWPPARSAQPRWRRTPSRARRSRRTRSPAPTCASARSDVSLTARDAQRLGGTPAGAYVARPVTVSATSTADTQRIKGPVVAACPAGTRVLSGGAAIHGAVTGASLVRSEPDGASGWTATARVTQTRRPRWRLEVSAVCAIRRAEVSRGGAQLSASPREIRGDDQVALERDDERVGLFTHPFAIDLEQGPLDRGDLLVEHEVERLGLGVRDTDAAPHVALAAAQLDPPVVGAIRLPLDRADARRSAHHAVLQAFVATGESARRGGDTALASEAGDLVHGESSTRRVDQIASDLLYPGERGSSIRRNPGRGHGRSPDDPGLPATEDHWGDHTPLHVARGRRVAAHGQPDEPHGDQLGAVLCTSAGLGTPAHELRGAHRRPSSALPLRGTRRRGAGRRALGGGPELRSSRSLPPCGVARAG